MSQSEVVVSKFEGFVVVKFLIPRISLQELKKYKTKNILKTYHSRQITWSTFNPWRAIVKL